MKRNTITNLTSNQSGFKKICDDFKDKHNLDVSYCKYTDESISAYFYKNKQVMESVLDFLYIPKGFEYKNGDISTEDTYDIVANIDDGFIIESANLAVFISTIEKLKPSSAMTF